MPEGCFNNPRRSSRTRTAIRPSDLLTLDDLLTRLASIGVRAARVAELRRLGGMTVGETAEQLGISARTVQTVWTMARLWLSKELGR